MKKRKILGSVLTFAFTSVFVFASCTNKTKQEEAKDDFNEKVVELKQESKQEMHDFNNYTYAEKDKFVKDANTELDKMDREINGLKEDLANAGDKISAETRAAHQKSINEMVKIRDDYKKSVDKVQNSTEQNWDQTKKDVGSAYDKTKSSIKKGWEDVKDNVNKGVNKAKDKLDK